MNNAANMNTMTMPAPSHTNMEHRYGCPATMTVVTFVVCGIIHRARRLWRSDMPTSCQIELYTICPYNTSEMCTDAAVLESAFSEDWLRYVDTFNPSRVDVAAMSAIAAVDGSTYQCYSLAFESKARFAAVELS